MRWTRRWTRWVLRWLAGLLMLTVLAGAAIAVALLVTPMQTVTVAGQVIQVGATAPSLSLSGPGEIDLFGQSLPTDLRFTGPVRPRLQLSQITINSELTTLIEGHGHASPQAVLGARLADGWKQYFAWETAIAGAGTVVLVGAVAGWRRLSAVHHAQAACRRARRGRGHQPGRHHGHHLYGADLAAPGALPQ